MDFDLDVSLFKFFKSQHDNQPIGTGCLKSVHGFEGNCFLACCLFLLLKCDKKTEYLIRASLKIIIRMPLITTETDDVQSGSFMKWLFAS